MGSLSVVDDELRDAARNNDLKRAKEALECGADPDASGNDGMTSLHICAQQAAPAIGKLLLDHGCSPNKPDSIGLSPLHWAVQSRREEPNTEKRLQMVRLLLEYHADPYQPDIRKVTALALAEKNQNLFALGAIRELTQQNELVMQ